MSDRINEKQGEPYQDLISEMGYGAGAVRVHGRFIMRPTSNNNVLMAGAIVPKLIEADEMWEVEIIIIPKRKFKMERKIFEGCRIDQMLTWGFADSRKWAKAPYWQGEDIPKWKNLPEEEEDEL